ncbi:hypothetical protein B0T10DRAFT_258851 [Thelonectria olida]|uniref:Uncharacterized protein n=1 Tax=Thelonectria olida TaxID=1576542 RepID=A0A9P8WDF5_9HYPO|nr:hypothetical protein B0T10DRAFT_258851 [Thelonectria olida]
MAEAGNRKFAISIVRLSFQQSAQSKIDVSPQWYKTMDRITKEANFRYVARGEGVDDACDIMLLVGWTHGTQPSAAFLPQSPAASAGHGNLDAVFAPLLPFLSQRPRVRTLWHTYERANANLLTTSFRGRGFNDPIMEFMTIRGPPGVVGPEVKAIESTLSEFWERREMSRFDEDVYRDTFDGVLLASLDDGLDAHETPSEPGATTFVIFLKWSSREGRAEFQDPTISDPTIGPAQANYPIDFWREQVAKPLQRLVEEGATISSWDYHKAKLATDKRGSQLVANASDIW